MPAKRILVTDHIFENLEIERSILGPLGYEVVMASAPTAEAIAAEAEGVAALLVCFAPVGAEAVRAASGSCQVISRYGIGYDNIDVDEASRNGIVVTNVPDYCIEEVADHTVAIMLALARSVALADRDVRAGNWQVPHGTVRRLRGQRLAVIGTGRIGGAVIERAAAFGLEIVAYDPYREPWDLEAERVDSVAEAVADATIITLHAPLTEENHHMIDGAAIAEMKRAPLLINTSRGGLVDTHAAAKALADGKLSGVGLDVTENEPLEADHPLRDQPRAIITPHMSYYSIEAQAELQERAARAVADVLEGRAPRNPVNPQVLVAK